MNVGTGTVLHAEEIPALPRRDPVTVLDDVLGLAERMRGRRGAGPREPFAGSASASPRSSTPMAGSRPGTRSTGSTFRCTNALERLRRPSSSNRTSARLPARKHATARDGGLDTFAYVTIGSGISSCLMIRGRPLVGHTGSAIALTSATTREHCPSCGETHDFCLEAYASGLGMTRRYAEATSRDVRRTEEIFDAAASGDVNAVHVIESAARALGKALAQLANLFDPPRSCSGVAWVRRLVSITTG